MRNILVHDYFSVDLDEVWVAAERDIPRLKTQVQPILKKLSAAQEDEPTGRSSV